MSNTTIAHANQTCAQTWNHLSINDIELVLPHLAVETLAAEADSPDARGVQSTPDTRVAQIEMGGGSELTSWIDSAASERVLLDIPAHSTQSHILRIEGPSAADIVVGPSAHLRLVVLFPTAHDKAMPAAGNDAPSALALRIQAAESAHVELYEVIANTSMDTCIDSCGIEAAANAHIDIHQWLLTAQTSVVGYACNLVGDGATCTLSTRYIGSGSQRLDMNYLMRMRGTNTKANLAFSGMLKDAARKRLADTIDLVHGCKGSKGTESETVLLAGDDVRNQSLPSVLCDEDDVEGAHGATIGSISPEQLAYLASRGVTQKEAEALFTRSAFDDCLRMVPEASQATLAAASLVLGEDIAQEIAEDATTIIAELSPAHTNSSHEEA